MFAQFGDSVKTAIALAQEEARELHADEIRPEHLLVGVLQSAGRELSSMLEGYGVTANAVRARLTARSSADDSFEDDAEALRSIGVDLRAIRDGVNQTFGADAWDNALPRRGRRGRRRGNLPFVKPSKKVLELSLREALAHKDNYISCEHVLLGILRGGDEFTVGLLTERVDAAQLRSALVDLLDEAA